MKCETCVHWEKPSDRVGFGNAINYRAIDGDWDTAHNFSDEADKMFGVCLKIDLGYDLDPKKPTPMAVTQDASQYRATLYTQAGFGCVLHEEVVDENSNNRIS